MAKVLPLPKELHPDFYNPRKKPVGPVEIDWDNPLTEGLVFAEFLLNERRERIEPFTGLRSTHTGNLKFSKSSEGVAFDPEGFGGVITYGASDWWDFGADDFTVIVRSNPPASGITADFSNGGGGNQWRLNPNFNQSAASSPGDYAFLTYAGSFLNAGTSGANVADGEVHTWGGSRTGNDLGLYRDGALIASNSGTPKNVTAGTNTDMQVGGWNAGASPSTQIYFALAFRKGKSAAEMKKIADKPYQILKPATPQLFFVASGGGPITNLSLAGSIAPAGDLQSFLSLIQSMGGTISPSGAASKIASSAQGGSATAVGSIQKQVSKLVFGSTNMTGANIKRVNAILDGSLTPTGTVITSFVALLSLAGSSIMSGLLAAVFVPASALGEKARYITGVIKGIFLKKE